METPANATGVIIADDNPLVRGMLRASLESIGQEVFLANDGLEAVALASRLRVALVLLDVRMPALDGFLACARIRELPGYDDTPIVMMTVDDGSRTQAAASRAGATQFLAKPFSSGVLMMALSNYLPIDESRLLQAIHANAVRLADGRLRY